MTRAEVLAACARLGMDVTEVRVAGTGILIVPALETTEEQLAAVLEAVPGAQVAIQPGSVLADHALEALKTSQLTGPSYELDDLEEDGTWKPGRRPAGWGDRP